MRGTGQIVAGVLVAAALSAVPVRVRAAEAGTNARYAGRGYRLRGYQWDQVLGQRWAVYESAAHPERPLVSELDPQGGDGAVLPAAASSQAPANPVVKVAEMVVHSGDEVTLWRQEANVKMQLSAVAEGSAALGGRVELRVTGAGVYGSTGWRATGFVRGPGSVEME